MRGDKPGYSDTLSPRLKRCCPSWLAYKEGYDRPESTEWCDRPESVLMLCDSLLVIARTPL